MHRLHQRIARLEGGQSRTFRLRDAVDRPARETRDQWLARQAGHPTPGLVNSRGETYGEWIDRRKRELSQ